MKTESEIRMVREGIEAASLQADRDILMPMLLAAEVLRWVLDEPTDSKEFSEIGILSKQLIEMITEAKAKSKNN